MKNLTAPLALLLAVTAGSYALAQRKVELIPGFGGIPVAPQGLWPNGTGRKLPTSPMVFDTAEGQKIKVVVVTKALAFPWSMAWLPNGDMLVTEREGRLRLLRNSTTLDPKPIAGAPMARNLGISGEPGAVHGYMDIALHPQFAQNGFVYLTYTKPIDAQKRVAALARGKWDG
ncbi:MAG TPA: PQQ-dependent sugar dehydrogenase, partial [Vicinamibacterales bacterium]|nr:PQQ-dependent sugar dehydrogenase [Vicinamibacterales bacterium]